MYALSCWAFLKVWGLRGRNWGSTVFFRWWKAMKSRVLFFAAGAVGTAGIRSCSNYARSGVQSSGGTSTRNCCGNVMFMSLCFSCALELLRLLRHDYLYEVYSISCVVLLWCFATSGRFLQRNWNCCIKMRTCDCFIMFSLNVLFDPFWTFEWCFCARGSCYTLQRDSWWKYCGANVAAGS